MIPKMKYMNTYRLLRNNKETGPYTSDQLITSGFKPYDLIWVEGKSAGWRYPGELPEFNVVAPVVEQQPFERFAQKSTYTQKIDTAILVPAHQDEEFHSVEQKIFTVPKTSIYVTLPGNAKGSTHRVILATKEFHKNKTATAGIAIPAHTELESPVIDASSGSGYFQQEEVVDSSLALSDEYNSHDQLAEESKVVELEQPKALSLFSKISIAVAILLFGFSIVLFINSLIQNREKSELARMVQTLKSKNKSAVNNQTVINSTTLPLLIDNKFIVTNEALAEASEAAASMIAPVLNDAEIEEVIVAPATVLSQNQSSILSNEPANKTEEAPVQEAIEPLHPSSWLINQISIENSDVIDFSKSGATSSIILTNNSPVAINQAEVTIISLDQSNQIMKKVVVKVENVAPGAKKEILYSKNGTETSLQYSISSISYKSSVVVDEPK